MLLAVPDSVDVPALIRARLPELSPNDRRIAAWLLEHEAEAPFQTAESLAAYRLAVLKATGATNGHLLIGLSLQTGVLAAGAA